MKPTLVVLLLCLACGSATPATTSTTTTASPTTEPTAPAPTRPSVSRPLDPRERAALDRLIGATELARDLRFVRHVDAFVQSPDAIAAHADTQLDDEDLAEAGLLYRGLGMIPPDLDLRAHLRELLGEQVLGYFDPEEDRLVLRDEVVHILSTRPGSPSALDARLVVVHELTHALQAHHLRLRELHDVERSSDADVAFHALVEGDAMLSMLVDLSVEMNVPLENLVTDAAIDQLASGAAGGGNDSLLAAPPIVRVSLVAPYVAGLRFVRALHASGGWRKIDDAFARLPASMEQVLHPERYLQGEAPEPLTLPEFPAFAAAGFERVDEDTLGELELSVFFARGTGEDTNAAAAAGWAGDLLRLYRAGDRPAIVWVIRFDDPREATEAESALRRVADPNDRFHRVNRSLLVCRHVPEAAEAEVLTWFRTEAAGPTVTRAPTAR
ncbi:MAG: hypothetical protein H6724_07725 [Sandaracinus sp.]|nr:hypothetical protein [Sandaracinus sp.]